MSSDFVILSLLIAAFTCRETVATCNVTSDTATTCSMDSGPLKKLFLPVDGSIGECRCNIKLVSDHVIPRAIITFTNHMINKPSCPYKITFMEYNVEMNCEISEIFDIPVTKERSPVFSITKDSSITDSTTTGGFCLNMTILQEKFSISCRPTTVSGITETDLTTSTESTVLTTNKDPSITGEDHTQTNMMTTTKDVLLNTNDEPIKEFPVIAVASGIAGGVVVIIIIIIIVFIWYLKRKNNIYDTPVQRRRDEHVYGNIQTRSLENLDISGQREDRSQGSPHTSDIGVGYNDSNPVTSSEKPKTFPSKKANNGGTIYENIASDL